MDSVESLRGDSFIKNIDYVDSSDVCMKLSVTMEVEEVQHWLRYQLMLILSTRVCPVLYSR